MKIKFLCCVQTSLIYSEIFHVKLGEFRESSAKEEVLFMMGAARYNAFKRMVEDKSS